MNYDIKIDEKNNIKINDTFNYKIIKKNDNICEMYYTQLNLYTNIKLIFKKYCKNKKKIKNYFFIFFILKKYNLPCELYSFIIKFLPYKIDKNFLLFNGSFRKEEFSYSSIFNFKFIWNKENNSYFIIDLINEISRRKNFIFNTYQEWDKLNEKKYLKYIFSKKPYFNYNSHILVN